MFYLFYFSQGIIQPGTIGEDGRPKPVSHVLELVENTANRPGGTTEDWTFAVSDVQGSYSSAIPNIVLKLKFQF